MDHRALPLAAAVADRDMLRPHADRLGAVAQPFAVDEIHLRRADEAGHEFVGRRVVELHRRADLLDLAGVEHDDLVGQRHRLDLVVGDVDHRRLQRAVQLGDLQPRVDAQRGVEVGQRLVEQEQFRLAHQRPADGDALALAAGQLGRPPLQIGLQRQHRRRRRDALGDQSAGAPACFRPSPILSRTVRCG